MQRASQWSSGSMAGNKTRTAKWTTSSPPCPGKITIKIEKKILFLLLEIFLNSCKCWYEKSYEEFKRNIYACKRVQIVKITTYRCISFSILRYWTMDRSLQRRLQKTNYQHIKRLCRDRGQLFEDPDFPPNNRSIYRNKKPALHPIVWLRPHVSLY